MLKPKTVNRYTPGYLSYCKITNFDKICLDYDYSNDPYPTWFKTTIHQY